MVSPRLMVETCCGHQGMFVDGSSQPLDGMARHPIGVATGYNKGGGRTYADWCPGGSRRPADPESIVAWLREQGAIDYEAAVKRGRLVTGDIPGVTEGDYRSIIDAALGGIGNRVEGEEE